MSGIPEATPIRLTREERAEFEGLARSTKTEYRLRQRARIVLLGGGRLGQPGDRPGSWLHDRNGVEVAGALWARPLRRAFGDRQPRRRTQIHRRDRQAHSVGPGSAGAGGTWALDRRVDRGRTWAMSMCNMSGASCAPRRSTLPRASPGARATIPPSRPRRPRSSGSISIRPTAPWCWRWTRSRRSRRWSGRRATSSFPTGARSPVVPRL